MKMARIVIIFYLLLTAAITVGDDDKRPVNQAVNGVAGCCDVCPPICPWPPSSVTVEF